MTAALESTLDYLAPRETLRSVVWGCLHCRNIDGRPYSHDLYPHLGAPGGPCDAMDDPAVRQVILQFASRLGKTFFGQMELLMKADCSPGPAMFASSIEKTAMEVTERTYKMFAESPRIAHQLLPENKRRKTCIDFEAMLCYLAWSQSVSTLADKDIEYLHAGEISKWLQKSTSDEGDPLELALERIKNIPHHKAILESTPTVTGKCRVEALRLQSSNCQLYVPCPHCRRYQLLDFDRIKWDKLPNGRSDRDLARRTARYECAHCSKAIRDHHRAPMMRAGVWVPEGCRVNDAGARDAIVRFNATLTAAGGDGASVTDGYEWLGWQQAQWIDGKPFRDGPEAGYQLSSLYALTLGWGQIAAKFVGCVGKPQKLRNFINSWLGRTWELKRREATWEQLAKRLTSPTWQHLQIPSGFSLLTVGIDKQESHFVYEITAWGPGERSHTIDYGTCDTEDKLIEILKRSLRYADGTPAKTKLALMDVNFRPKNLHRLCRRLTKLGIPTLPCRGSQNSLGVEYQKRKLGKDTAAPGRTYIFVDTLTTQDWIEGTLHDTQPGEDGSFTVYHLPVDGHQDYFEQLLNDAPSLSDDGKRQSWDRVDASLPNDQRDTKRYAYVAYKIVTRGKDLAARDDKSQDAQPKPRRRRPGTNAAEQLRRPGGWLTIPK